MERNSLICLINHFESFRQQATNEEKADFGKPCAECELWQDCKGGWVSKIGDIAKDADKKISVVESAQP